jgi:hypothetical protein
MKEKTKLAWLLGLIALAAVVWFLQSRGPSSSADSSQIAEGVYKPLAVENPELQRAKLDASRKTEYKSTGRDLFSEIAPPPPEALKKQEVHVTQGPVVQPPPPPPSLPPTMKFFGYGTIPNGTARRAFLSDGDDVYIVAEGDTLLGKYRIVKIGNANLDFEEVGSGRRGSASISEESAPPS